MEAECEALRAQIKNLIEELERIRNENSNISDCGEGTSSQPQGGNSNNNPNQAHESDDDDDDEEFDDSNVLINRLMTQVRISLSSLAGQNFERLLRAANRASKEVMKIKTILEFIDRIEDERIRASLKYEYLLSWIAENNDADEMQTTEHTGHTSNKQD